MHKRRGRQCAGIGFCLMILGCVCVLLPGAVCAEEYLNQGRDQLVDALDAAIARVIDSGTWRTIVNSDAGAAQLVVNIGDCYPRIQDGSDEVYPFPQNPVGLLADILASKQIRVGDYDVNDPFVPGTFHVFDTINPALLRAIIDELGAAYGIPPSPDPGAIQIIPVYLWPPSSALMFSGLNNGDFDITGFNAALGATVSVGGVEKRRRKVARFTCTVFGTPWYIHVRNDSSYTTLDDVIADTTAKLCVGQLSSRLSEDYFKNAASIDKMFTTDDLTVCSEGVRDGIYDAYLHFDPVPVSYPAPNDLRSIPMRITSGIPIWVGGDADQDMDRIADDQDNCPLNYNPCQEDADGNGIGDACEGINCTVDLPPSVTGEMTVTVADQDCDGIAEDGDYSGVAGDNPCTGGAVSACDDNCPDIANALQEDADSNGIGDVCEATMVKMSSMSATASNKMVTLQWATDSEVANAGFNVWRATGFERVNADLIPARGTPSIGGSYSFINAGLVNRMRYYYLIEDVDIFGNSTFHGPVSATPRIIYKVLDR